MALLLDVLHSLASSLLMDMSQSRSKDITSAKPTKDESVNDISVAEKTLILLLSKLDYFVEPKKGDGLCNLYNFL